MRERATLERYERPSAAQYFEWALLLVASSVLLGIGGFCLAVTLMLG